MSILIKGMEMPKSCKACMFKDVYGLCLINKHIEGRAVLTHSCPLVEIPPHGRLIDEDALCEGLVSNHEVMIYAKTAPTIIEAEEGE